MGYTHNLWQKGPKYTHSHCGLKPSILDSDSSIQDFVNSVIYRYP